MSRQVSLTGEPVEAPPGAALEPTNPASQRTAILEAAPPDTSWRQVARWIVRARAEAGEEEG